MTSVAYRGKISWSTFRRAQWTHLGRRWWLLFAFPLIVTPCTMSIVEGTSIKLGAGIFAVATLFVPAMLAFLLVQWRLVYGRSPYLRDLIVGSISDDKLVAESSKGKNEVKLSSFVNVKDSGDVLLLYHSPYLYNILSRELFESDHEWADVKRMVSARGTEKASAT